MTQKPLSHRRHMLHHTSGFSIVELMITISIIILVTGIALSRYSSFNNSVLLQSQAFELAFDIRQVQQTGISVQASGSATRNGFGMYFNENNRSRYVFFEDVDNNGTFNAGDEEITTFVIDPRFEIVDLRIGASSPSAAAVTFRRPNFDAILNPVGTALEIDLATEIGASAVRTVTVSRTGQISVQ